MKKIITTLGFLLLATACGFAETLEIKNAECAGMSGFRKFWDMPIPVAEDGARQVADDVVKDWGAKAVWDGENPGPLAFDAVNRMLLVRFPDAAAQIAAKVKEGFTIEKVEMALTHMDEELWPQGDTNRCSNDGYRYRMNWDCDKLYRAHRPNWHAIAFALRKPWKADKDMGPTFNAAVNGAVYWKRFGATDTKEDRFETQFGPTEVSSYKPNGRMDITALLTDKNYGATLAERLRLISDCGFMLSKWEVYDARYYNGAYEFTTPTGPRAVVIKQPSLIVTFKKGNASENVSLAVAADISGMHGKVKGGGRPTGTPTAVLPSPQAVVELNKKFQAKPAWMKDWQYKHVQELMALERGNVQPFYYRIVPEYLINRVIDGLKRQNSAVTQAEIDYAVYQLWIDWVMSTPPRAWDGHLTGAESVLVWYNYREALPGPATDLILKSWTAWLMPDRKTIEDQTERRNFDNITGDLVHPMVDDPRVGRNLEGKQAVWEQGNVYYKKTGDWRGNRSYYRSGFTREQSTQNFNSSATAGALLNGQIVGSEYAMEDGRIGMMKFPFWMWTYSSGVGQEYVDHYYWAVSFAGNKLFPDYSERLQDKMVGWSIIEKNMEDLAGAYHPNLKKLLGPTSRTYYEHVLGRQDGLYFILHTMSPKGTLTDTKTGKLPLISKDTEKNVVGAWGSDFPAGSVAQQTLSGPWTDAWVSELVDEKPLPWSLFAQKEGSWVTTYFGENYGLASIVNKQQRIHALGHWRRQAARPESMSDIGTLDMRIGFNEQTRFANDGDGWLSHQGGYRTYQHKNKLLMIAKPDMKMITEQAKGRKQGNIEYPKQDIHSVQCSVALFNFEQPKPTWEIYVDQQKINALPATAKFGQIITIKDGVSYIAIRPLDGGTVGRDAEVTLVQGIAETQPHHENTNFQAALVVNAYLYKKNTAISEEDSKKLDNMRSGFIVEMGDEKEYKTFADFQKAILAAKCDVTKSDDGMKVRYQSGKDTLEADWTPETKDAVTLLVNGKSPYPSNEVWRDTSLTQMAKGRLEKNGAVVERETSPWANMLLQTFPKQKIYVATNLLPNYLEYTFSTPDGVKISADGALSMGRWAVKGTSEIDIRYCEFENEFAIPAEMRAKALFITGMKEKPTVIYNGKNVTDRLRTETQNGVAGWKMGL